MQSVDHRIGSGKTSAPRRERAPKKTAGEYGQLRVPSEEDQRAGAIAVTISGVA